ncbi:MAG: SRPBCC family protein [Chloroflexi bacterium]|nr:SRPBCC family protein [Chloroflexota bacterium]
MFLKFFEFHMSSGVFIDAPSELVWRIVEDAERWPEWSKGCTEVWGAPIGKSWCADHKFGFKLRMACRNVPFSVTISRIDSGRLIEWRSTKFSITAVRSISIESDGDGCRVMDRKHFSSTLLPIRLTYPRWLIRQMTESWLGDMKAEAELSK